MPGLTAVRVFCLAPQKELTKTQDQTSHGNRLGFATHSGVKRTSLRTFYLTDTGTNEVLTVHATGLNVND
jgi:hypothetical protein